MTQFVAYESLSPATTPAPLRYIAKIIERGAVMPVHHFGATAEEALGKSETWWNEQMAKATRKTAPRAKKAAPDAPACDEVI